MEIDRSQNTRQEKTPGEQWLETVGLSELECTPARPDLGPNILGRDLFEHGREHAEPILLAIQNTTNPDQKKRFIEAARAITLQYFPEDVQQNYLSKEQ